MKYNIAVNDLPIHIGFIMDGNGRWASKRGLPRNSGHRAGVKALKRIANDCFDIGIKVVTVYVFSTENKFRPQKEVDGLISLLRQHLKSMLKTLMSKGVRVNFMGDLSYFPIDVQTIMADIVNDSKDGVNGILNMALNYGARDEIIRAVNSAVDKGEPVDESSFSKLLYTANIPDPDMIVRTSGEKRLSNFMLYQSAYSELFFTETLWPDFDTAELIEILQEYNLRTRKFGKIN